MPAPSWAGGPVGFTVVPTGRVGTSFTVLVLGDVGLRAQQGEVRPTGSSWHPSCGCCRWTPKGRDLVQRPAT